MCLQDCRGTLTVPRTALRPASQTKAQDKGGRWQAEDSPQPRGGLAGTGSVVVAACPLALQRLSHSGALNVPLGGTSCALGGAQPSLGIADLGPTGRLVGHGKLAGTPHTRVFSRFFNQHFGPHILSNAPEPGATLVGPWGPDNSPSRPEIWRPRGLCPAPRASNVGPPGVGAGQVCPLRRPPTRHLCGIRATPLWWLLVPSPGPSPGTFTPFQPLAVCVFKTFPEEQL